ncbi:hypothetical protein AVEN_38478-1 [Araneus ventricosus]|uniref:Uncharacterized protein n=1 Tax=Araneus ventricosus TaxID=182803 RepID=A0A4Y2H5W9_ARAVE|nr:hypothetical protein AVEN_38478-1 [Araneus ventricosus]
MGTEIKAPPGTGPYCFHIHGQIYHMVSPLHSNERNKPVYGQLYIFDSSERNGRYVSAPEAMWRLSEFSLSENSHVIMRLAVHLKNQQQVVFQSGQEVVAVDRASMRHTTFAAWFHLNQHDVEVHNYNYAGVKKINMPHAHLSLSTIDVVKEESKSRLNLEKMNEEQKIVVQKSFSVPYENKAPRLSFLMDLQRQGKPLYTLL